MLTIDDLEKKWNVQGIYEPICRDFGTQKEADDYMNFIQKKAKEQGIAVQLVEFSWKVGQEVVPKK